MKMWIWPPIFDPPFSGQTQPMTPACEFRVKYLHSMNPHCLKGCSMIPRMTPLRVIEHVSPQVLFDPAIKEFKKFWSRVEKLQSRNLRLQYLHDETLWRAVSDLKDVAEWCWMLLCNKVILPNQIFCGLLGMKIKREDQERSDKIISPIRIHSLPETYLRKRIENQEKAWSIDQGFSRFFFVLNGWRFCPTFPLLAVFTWNLSMPSLSPLIMTWCIVKAWQTLSDHVPIPCIPSSFHGNKPRRSIQTHFSVIYRFFLMTFYCKLSSLKELTVSQNAFNKITKYF